MASTRDENAAFIAGMGVVIFFVTMMMMCGGFPEVYHNKQEIKRASKFNLSKYDTEKNELVWEDDIVRYVCWGGDKPNLKLCDKCPQCYNAGECDTECVEEASTCTGRP